MKRTLFVLLGIQLLSGFSAGLQCWSCDNRESVFECIFRGRLVTCAENEGSCITIVRRCGPKYAWTKGCKQTDACLTDARIQVTPTSNGAVQCNTDQESSVCTCCCEGNKCNRNSRPCGGMTFDCEDRGEIVNGTTACTEDNRAGSICEFTCNDPVLTPLPTDQTRCLPSGNWDFPLPCCAMQCPPFFVRDVLFMRQTDNEIAWEEFINRVRAYFNTFVFGTNNLRVGVVPYGSVVHEDERLLFVASTNERRFEQRLSRLMFTNDTGEVNTGLALRYLPENVFQPEIGDRPNVPNIVVLQADSASSDLVEAAARELRNANVLIYAVISPFNSDPVLLEQLLEITGSQERILLESSVMDFVEDLADELCNNVCG